MCFGSVLSGFFFGSCVYSKSYRIKFWNMAASRSIASFFHRKFPNVTWNINGSVIQLFLNYFERVWFPVQHRCHQGEAARSKRLYKTTWDENLALSVKKTSCWTVHLRKLQWFFGCNNIQLTKNKSAQLGCGRMIHQLGFYGSIG